MAALDLAELIRERAYQRWQARGESPGAADDDWFEAEREIREMDAQVKQGLEENSASAEATASPVGKPGNASRQQTHPGQGIQSGEPELDSKDAGSPRQQRQYRDRPAEDGKHGDGADESAAGPIQSGTQDEGC